MESNYITGEAICELLEAINVNQKVIEFKIANQVRICNNTNNYIACLF